MWQLLSFSGTRIAHYCAQNIPQSPLFLVRLIQSTHQHVISIIEFNFILPSEPGSSQMVAHFSHFPLKILYVFLTPAIHATCPPTLSLSKYSLQHPDSTTGIKTILCLLPASCLAYSSMLKMGAILSIETFADSYSVTQRYNQENRTLDSHRCEDLKSNKVYAKYIIQ
jgi:hypothetical protein